MALAGFLGGYRGLSRDAYALDLRQFVAFGYQRHLQRSTSDIETFGRELEARGRATATNARRLCTVTGFYRYAEEEGLTAIHRQSMSAGPGSTMSPTPSA